MHDAMERMNMTRAYDRILKIASAIADLGACAEVSDHHIIGRHQRYLNLDRGTYMGSSLI